MRPPSAANTFAMSAPMPRLAPVTTTTLPLSRPVGTCAPLTWSSSRRHLAKKNHGDHEVYSLAGRARDDGEAGSESGRGARTTARDVGSRAAHRARGLHRHLLSE